jgi:uncharacterized protein YkwD
MSLRTTTANTFRRLAVAGAAIGVAGSFASSAQATSCKTLEHKYADRDITHVATVNRETTGFCLIQDARKANGVTAPIKNSSYLQHSARGHAVVSTQLQYWSLTDGLVSHVEPSQAGMTPSAAIAQRIAKAGFCKSGTPNTNENTYSAWGNGANASTLRGSVNWWLSDPPHRATLLSTAYKYVGVGAISLSAFPTPTNGAQAITVVADFGTCS